MSKLPSVWTAICQIYLLGLGIALLSFSGRGNASNSKPVEVYKCTDSTSVLHGDLLTVQSLTFGNSPTEILLRIKESNFRGCSSFLQKPAETELLQNLTTLVNLTESQQITEIETYHSSISPSGVLNVQGHFYTNKEYCVKSYHYSPYTEKVGSINGTDVAEIFPILKLEYCPVSCSNHEGPTQRYGEKCFRKCCSMEKSIEIEDGQVTACKSTVNGSIWNGFFYDENDWNHLLSSEEKAQLNPHFYRKKLQCKTTQVFWFMRRNVDGPDGHISRLLTNGSFIYINSARQWSLIPEGVEFCFDSFHLSGSHYTGSEMDQVVVVCDDTLPEETKSAEKSKIYMIALFLASVFYFGTALTYILLWDKQNSHGWTCFSLFISQFFMCIFLGNAHRLGLNGGSTNSVHCYLNGILAHFFILASYSWLVLINLDLWWNFRTLRTCHQQRSKTLKKFAFYSLPGWGVPLTVVIAGVILNTNYPHRESLVLVPEYGKDICFITTSAQGPYVYYMMGSLLSIVILLSTSTCVRIHSFHKETQTVRTSSNAKDRKILILYAKLSIILGSSWIFEFISWAFTTESSGQNWVWVALDMYNLFTAVLIFIIFSCKESNLTMLENKYPVLKRIRVAIPIIQGTSSSNTNSTKDVNNDKNNHNLDGCNVPKNSSSDTKNNTIPMKNLHTANCN